MALDFSEKCGHWLGVEVGTDVRAGSNDHLTTQHLQILLVKGQTRKTLAQGSAERIFKGCGVCGDCWVTNFPGPAGGLHG